MEHTRRSLDQLKEAALHLSEKLGGKTPSKTQLREVVRESEYRYYGLTTKQFQEYCGLTANKSGLDQKVPDDELLKLLFDLSLQENQLVNQRLLRKWTRAERFPIHTAETRLDKMDGIRARLADWAEENGVLDSLRSLPGWREDKVARKRIPRSLKPTLDILNDWSPSQTRNSEESFKAGLSTYLKSKVTDEVREEKGESLCDISVGMNIGIELKRAPTLADYDRCFGQIARHLSTFEHVVVIIFNVPKQDQFDDFCALVDRYYSSAVVVLKKNTMK